MSYSDVNNPNDYNPLCDHCRTRVPVAFVCPNCGKHHSDEWVATNQHPFGVIATIIVLPLMYFTHPYISFSHFFLWFFGCFLIAAIAAGSMVGFGPTDYDIEQVRKSRITKYGN